MKNHISTDPTPKAYRSRYSVLLLAIVLFPIFFMLYQFIRQPDVRVILILILFIGIVIMVSGFQYVITGDKLIFKLWFIKTGEIHISSITKINRSYLALSSNAGSFKRLYITLKKGSPYPFLLISPNNENEFLNALKEINPQIEMNVESKRGKFRFWDWDI